MAPTFILLESLTNDGQYRPGAAIKLDDIKYIANTEPTHCTILLRTCERVLKYTYKTDQFKHLQHGGPNNGHWVTNQPKSFAELIINLELMTR